MDEEEIKLVVQPITANLCRFKFASRLLGQWLKVLR